jgi:hypothetical protein
MKIYICTPAGFLRPGLQAIRQQYYVPWRRSPLRMTPLALKSIIKSEGLVAMHPMHGCLNVSTLIVNQD